MNALARFLIGLLLVALPLVGGLLAHRETLETPRLNLQRAPIKSSLFLSPFQTLTTTITADEDDLNRLDIFMRPAEWGAQNDRYEATLTDTETGEQRGPMTLPSSELWDDVGTLKFESFNASQGHTYTLALTAAPTNAKPLQLATDTKDRSLWILQPFYHRDTSFFTALKIMTERLGEIRLFLLFILATALGGLLREVRFDRTA